MNSIFTDPIIGVVVAQTLLVWGFVLSHWGAVRLTKWLTIGIAIPLTLLGIWLGYLRASAEHVEKYKDEELFHDIHLKTVDIEKKATVLNGQIDAWDQSFKQINETVQNTFASLKKLSAANSQLDDLTKTIAKLNDNLRVTYENQKDRLATMNQQINGALAQFQESLRAIKETEDRATEEAERAREGEKRYRNCIEEQKDQKRLCPSCIFPPCRDDYSNF